MNRDIATKKSSFSNASSLDCSPFFPLLGRLHAPRKAIIAVTFLKFLTVCLSVVINIYIYKALREKKRKSIERLNKNKKGKVCQCKAAVLVLLMVATMVVICLPLSLLFTITPFAIN